MTNYMVKSGSGTGSGRISQKQIWYSPKNYTTANSFMSQT